VQRGASRVLEFGLRRAQGIDGGLAASRAAYLGGCAATSNVLAGRLYGIPVRGTHAHSWVTSFDDEMVAFQAYAEAMPNNCVLLVDTYDTLEGVRHAVEVGRVLKEQGHSIVGVRLDSGDLAELSKAARAILDEGGFPDAAIVASNDLDEYRIEDLKQSNATIGVWGVGTRLVTGHDQPALGGVYKLSAIRSPGKAWQDRLKVSEDAIKTTTPGRLQVRRYEEGGRFIGDVVYELAAPPVGDCQAVDWYDQNKQQTFSEDLAGRDLLVNMLRHGKTVSELPGVEEARKTCQRELAMLDAQVQRPRQPKPYLVCMERRLAERKAELIGQARGDSK